MTTRAQLLILALIAALVLLAILFPRPAASDAPVVASAVPQSEFVPVGSAGPLSGQAIPGAPFQPRTLPVVGSPPILEEPAPSPSVRAVPSVAPVHPDTKETSDATAPGPRLIRVASTTGISGVASWFASPSGVSAAGPALRTALGPGWRGRQVSVCAGRRCIAVVLGDWCACSGRVIDLDDDQFSRLAPLSRGIVEVTISWQ